MCSLMCRFRTVELNCLPKLQRFTYDSWRYSYDPFVLGFVPQLSKLSLSALCRTDIHITLRLSHLLVNVPSISDLHLGFQSGKVLTLVITVSLLYDSYMWFTKLLSESQSPDGPIYMQLLPLTSNLFFCPRFGFSHNASSFLRLCSDNYGLWI